MPIYEYKCAACGHIMDVLQKIGDPTPANCPKCDQDTMQKQVTAASFKLKGTGWYETDFKNKKPAEGKTDSNTTDKKSATPSGKANKQADKSGASK